jgi:Heterokaryon incompatibility protein (HET)
MVGSIDRNEEPRLIQSECQKGLYLTLSHCWGGSTPPATTSSTYEKHLTSIPFESFPKTFQDAITVTRTLDIPFLWIDSLCIIQDSNEDWERECQKMPEIYRNSMATIAGPAAADCKAGFLHRRPATDQDWTDIRWQVNNSMTYCDVVLESIGDDWFSPGPEADSALSKRAWVLQERLLSPRVLYFGTKRMYWECFTDQRYEDMHYSAITGSLSWGGIEKTPFDQSKDRQWWLSYWYRIVKSYTAAGLTFHTDRFPALSALVSIMQAKLGDIYVAGLWKTDICRGLTWYSPTYDLNETMLHDRDRYIAPSWSWASARNAVRLANYGLDHDPKEEKAEVLDVVLEQAGAKSLGQIGGGHIEIRGKVAVGVIRIGLDVDVPGRRTIYFFDAGPKANILGTFYPDDPRISAIFPDCKTDSAQTDDLFSLRREILVLHLCTNALEGRRVLWAAMAIEPLLTLGGEWRRIGLVEGDFDGFPAARSLFQMSRQTTMKIV